jgi:hypothetical protein
MGEVFIAGAIEYFGGCGFAGLQEGTGPFQFFLFKPIAGGVLKRQVAVLFQRVLQEGNKPISIGIGQVDHDLFELDLQ